MNLQGPGLKWGKVAELAPNESSAQKLGCHPQGPRHQFPGFWFSWSKPGWAFLDKVTGWNPESKDDDQASKVKGGAWSAAAFRVLILFYESVPVAEKTDLCSMSSYNWSEHCVWESWKTMPLNHYCLLEANLSDAGSDHARFWRWKCDKWLMFRKTLKVFAQLQLPFYCDVSSGKRSWALDVRCRKLPTWVNSVLAHQWSHNENRWSPKKQTRDLAPKANLFRCRHRHALCEGGGRGCRTLVLAWLMASWGGGGKPKVLSSLNYGLLQYYFGPFFQR